MSQPPPPMPERQPPPQPPPIPPASPPTANYAPPGPQPLPPAPGAGDAQRVFDTVAGPNLRMRDNLIQLACVIVGTVGGALIGRAFQEEDGAPLMLWGALGGLVVSVLVSGLVIGVIRTVAAARQRRGG